MKLSDKIQTSLMHDVRSGAYDILIPNYYFDGYEMDLFKMSPSGLITEFEIKISRPDYKKDFEKHRGYGNDNKHSLMQFKKSACNRFYFVMPENLISVTDIPNYCGLIYYSGSRLIVVKAAPLIHKVKQPIEVYKRLAQSLAWRELIMRSKFRRMKFEFERYKKQSA